MNTTCAQILKENAELRHEVKALSARNESLSMQVNGMMEHIATMAATQQKMFKMLTFSLKNLLEKSLGFHQRQ